MGQAFSKRGHAYLRFGAGADIVEKFISFPNKCGFKFQDEGAGLNALAIRLNRAIICVGPLMEISPKTDLERYSSLAKASSDAMRSHP